MQSVTVHSNAFSCGTNAATTGALSSSSISSSSVTFPLGGNTALTHYQEIGPTAVTFVGGFAENQTTNLYCTRIGNVVHLRIGGVDAPGKDVEQSSLASLSIPVGFRPSASTFVPIIIKDQGVYKAGGLFISGVGSMTIGKLPGIVGPFTAGGLANGWTDISVTYRLN